MRLSEITSDIVARAKALFGITHNPKEAGYILADGTMLDLSGRHQVEHDYKRDASGRNIVKKLGQPDYMADQRFVDHREVNDLYDLSDNTKAMLQFMAQAPALRFHPGVGFDVAAIPTRQQVAKALAAHFSLTTDPIHIDVSDPVTGDVIDTRDFSRREIPEIMPFIEKCLDRKPVSESAHSNGLTLQVIADHLVAVNNDILPEHYLEVEWLKAPAFICLDVIKRIFLYGSCAEFAYALHEKHGWSIFKFHNQTSSKVHYACKISENEYCDFAGKIPLETILRRYQFGKKVIIKEVNSGECASGFDLDDDDPLTGVAIARYMIDYLGL